MGKCECGRFRKLSAGGIGQVLNDRAVRMVEQLGSRGTGLFQTVWMCVAEVYGTTDKLRCVDVASI